MITAKDVADYFLYKAEAATEEDQELISNLKLQKLVYYAQGLYLALHGEPLFLDRIEAWQYGPVVPELYHHYKSQKSAGISANKSFNPLKINKDIRTFLDDVYEAFGQFSAIQLMRYTHADRCWIDAGIGNEIACESMRIDLKKYLKDGSK